MATASRRTPPPRWEALLRAGAIVVLIVPLLAPFLHPGWIVTHERHSYPVRLVEVLRCWEDGMPSARWFPDLNYGQGYPFLCFYAPLFFYAAGALHWAGADVFLALKLVVVLAALLGAAGTYRLLREALAPPAAFLGAALFTYAPYGVIDLYARGDLSELLAMGFLPWSLLAVLRLRRRFSPRDSALAAFAPALIVLSHNVLGMLAAGFLTGAAAIAVGSSPRKRCTALAAAGAGAGALLVSSFFWAPALHERQWVHTERMVEGFYGIERGFLSPARIVGLAPPEQDVRRGSPLRLRIGPLALLLAPLAALTARRSPPARPLVGLCALVTALAALMTLSVSQPIYRVTPLLRFVQFPWRFLAALSLGMAGLAASGAEFLLRRLRAPVRWTLALIGTGIAYSLVHGEIGPAENFALLPSLLDPEAMREHPYTATMAHEFLPVWVEKREPPRGFTRGVKVLGRGEARRIARGAGRYDFLLAAREPVTVVLRDMYYPGWEGTIDGQPLELRPRTPEGNVEFRAGPGEGRVRIRLEPTPLRRRARHVSLAAGIALIGVLVFGGERRPRGARSCAGGAA